MNQRQELRRWQKIGRYEHEVLAVYINGVLDFHGYTGAYRQAE